MLEGDPGRHNWGLGRHFIGSNFLWCLRDPAGNFSGDNSDRDTITDDKLWKPGTWEPSLQALYAWGRTACLHAEPDDLAELMADSHCERRHRAGAVGCRAWHPLCSAPGAG